MSADRQTPSSQSGQHDAFGSFERERLWDALSKSTAAHEELARQVGELKVAVAVLQLKASIWTIVGAFLATGLWFLKDLLAKK